MAGEAATMKPAASAAQPMESLVRDLRCQTPSLPGTLFIALLLFCCIQILCSLGALEGEVNRRIFLALFLCHLRFMMGDTLVAIDAGLTFFLGFRVLHLCTTRLSVQAHGIPGVTVAAFS
jgi:hypothetical protein